MRIFALETSCDETAGSVVDDGIQLLSDVLATSKHSFEASGGVIPEEAARKQVECIVPIIHQSLEEAGVEHSDLDAIAVTRGPGLSGSLLVGTTAARTLASLWKKPLIGVHHTLGHLSSPWLECDEIPEFPILTLSVSGGHSDVWYRTSHTQGTLLGRTRDDAAGEAFDKGAALLGLPYPGGPAIQKAAEHGSTDAFDFPAPLHDKDTMDFSFSGLKTALKYTIRDLPNGDSKPVLADLAASYQMAICAHLLSRLERALKQYEDVQEIHIVGGVSANSALRDGVTETFKDHTVRFPQKISYCTDNAAMIAAAGFFLVEENGDEAFATFETTSSLPLTEVVH